MSKVALVACPGARVGGKGGIRETKTEGVSRAKNTLAREKDPYKRIGLRLKSSSKSTIIGETKS